MDLATQQQKADAFRQLHGGPDILILANAWDAASARVFEAGGFTAIGTTSLGIAASLGYPDGKHLLWEEMLDVIQRIAAAVDLPVSADIEAGYGVIPREVAETVRQTVEAGAVGINLEDGSGSADTPLFEVPLQVERLQAAREAGRAADVPIVINARTDVYWLQVGEEKGRLDHAIYRANAYRAAGADCCFIPGVRDGKVIAKLVQGIPGPINILATPGVPPIPELARLGVARVSIGSGPLRATLALTKRIGKELRGPGTYTALFADTLTFTDLRALMTRPSRR